MLSAPFHKSSKHWGDLDKEHSRGCHGPRSQDAPNGGPTPDKVTTEKRDEKERFGAPKGLGPYGSGSFRQWQTLLRIKKRTTSEGFYFILTNPRQ